MGGHYSTGFTALFLPKTITSPGRNRFKAIAGSEPHPACICCRSFLVTPPTM